MTDELLEETGYLLFQVVVTEDEKMEIVASRAIGIAPETLRQEVTVQSGEAFTPDKGEEMGFVISHRGPALISAVIQDAEGSTVCRLLSREPTRPEQIYPEGTTLYWDGKKAGGARAEAGIYRLYVRLEQGDGTGEAFSQEFLLKDAEK